MFVAKEVKRGRRIGKERPKSLGNELIDEVKESIVKEIRDGNRPLCVVISPPEAVVGLLIRSIEEDLSKSEISVAYIEISNPGSVAGNIVNFLSCLDPIDERLSQPSFDIEWLTRALSLQKLEEITQELLIKHEIRVLCLYSQSGVLSFDATDLGPNFNIDSEYIVWLLSNRIRCPIKVLLNVLPEIVESKHWSETEVMKYVKEWEFPAVSLGRLESHISKILAYDHQELTYGEVSQKSVEIAENVMRNNPNSIADYENYINRILGYSSSFVLHQRSTLVLGAESGDLEKFHKVLSRSITPILLLNRIENQIREAYLSARWKAPFATFVMALTSAAEYIKILKSYFVLSFIAVSEHELWNTLLKARVIEEIRNGIAPQSKKSRIPVIRMFKAMEYARKIQNNKLSQALDIINEWLSFLLYIREDAELSETSQTNTFSIEGYIEDHGDCLQNDEPLDQAELLPIVAEAGGRRDLLNEQPEANGSPEARSENININAPQVPSERKTRNQISILGEYSSILDTVANMRNKYVHNEWMKDSWKPQAPWIATFCSEEVYDEIIKVLEAFRSSDKSHDGTAESFPNGSHFLMCDVVVLHPGSVEHLTNGKHLINEGVVYKNGCLSGPIRHIENVESIILGSPPIGHQSIAFSMLEDKILGSLFLVPLWQSGE